MKRILLLTLLVTSFYTQTADVEIYENGLPFLMTCMHIASTCYDPFIEKTSHLGFIIKYTCKTTGIFIASDFISTECTNQFCDGDPYAKRACMLCTDATLLGVCYKIDECLAHTNRDLI